MDKAASLTGRNGHIYDASLGPLQFCYHLKIPAFMHAMHRDMEIYG